MQLTCLAIILNLQPSNILKFFVTYVLEVNARLLKAFYHYLIFWCYVCYVHGWLSEMLVSLGDMNHQDVWTVISLIKPTRLEEDILQFSGEECHVKNDKMKVHYKTFFLIIFQQILV